MVSLSQWMVMVGDYFPILFIRNLWPLQIGNMAEQLDRGGLKHCTCVEAWSDVTIVETVPQKSNVHICPMIQVAWNIEEGKWSASERVIINISKSWLSTVWNRMRFNLTNCLECHTRSVSVRWGRHGRRRNIYHFDPKSSLDTLDIHRISLQGTHCL